MANQTLDSTSVTLVKINDYKSKYMLHWNNGLSLYNLSEDMELYDIVFYIPETMRDAYRLSQTDNIFDAQIKFIYLEKEIVPLINAVTAKKIAINLETFRSIIDTYNNNPTWSRMHLAAHFDYCQLFDCDSMEDVLDKPDEAGMTPLLVAITRNNLKSIEALVQKNCFIYHKDLNKNTIFHHAATSAPEILTILLKDVPSLAINSKNSFGYTPVHLACSSENHKSLKALLIAGADINIPACNNVSDYRSQSLTLSVYIQDNPNFLNSRVIKHGGTPLHWVDTVEEINQLVDHSCDVNALNFQEKTALHLMVENKKFDCIIALLSRGADPNIQDSRGNTPLHLAVQIPDNIHVLQSLIVFGADLNILNHNGESPRHLLRKKEDPQALYCLHAVGAKRCAIGTVDCNDRCYIYGNDNGERPPLVNEYENLETINNMLDVAGMEMVTNKHTRGIPRKGRLLSLDGGGIRGLILIQMLLELENVIGRPINHCFDWMTGTSTGAILALGLASGKTAKECLGLYFRFKNRMFAGTRPYPSKPLEEVLQEMLGDDIYLQDITFPKLIIPCCLADRQPIELYLYRNYESPNQLLKNENPPENTLMWHVARATSAAPTYFREDEQCPVSVVISLGTGLVPMKNSVELPENLPDILKVLIELPGLLSILIDQATATDGRVVERARAWCASNGVPYFRFNPQMSEEVGLNEKCNYKLCRILWETKAYMYANTQKIKEVGALLKDE
ncbi:calcium-independent phospholipase a2 [Holotrichia oblita]|uniref:Calcium-independent phospholipase a2 n=1 Tax=Holotrichia oblita TaxID=644536 RepID=A0ACB9TU06_HOLOL|nr:calcium-independent phospholipase a2 [Holotrichia oblita]